MRIYVFVTALPLLCLAACNSQNESDLLSAADSVKFSTDIRSLNAPSRKIIKKGNLVCEVADVLPAVQKTEQVVNSLGGMVMESNMLNEAGDMKEVYYSVDSIKKVSTYTPSVHMVIKVPAAFTDSVMNILTGMSRFTSKRIFNQYDETYTYLANAIKNQHTDTQAVGQAEKLADDAVEALQVDHYKQDATDERTDRRIENLKLLDDVNYATLNVQFSAPQHAVVAIIPDVRSMTSVPFFSELGLAIMKGMNMLRGLLLVIITIWPFSLIAGVVLIMMYRKRSRVARM